MEAPKGITKAYYAVNYTLIVDLASFITLMLSRAPLVAVAIAVIILYVKRRIKSNIYSYIFKPFLKAYLSVAKSFRV